jgi:hypothetical protein
MLETQSPPDRPGSVSRPLLLWTWIALGAYLVACLTLWVQQHWQPEWDSALYLLTARSLAEGGGYVYLGEPFTLRPPGFSWLLSYFFDGGAVDVVLLNRLVMGSVGLAVASVYLALRRAHGQGLALAVAALTASSPLFPECFPKLLSDFPFLACLFLGLALVDGGPRRGRWATGGAALCFVVAFYLRSAAILLVPVLCVLGFVRRRSEVGGAEGDRAAGDRFGVGAWIPAAALVLCALPWVLHSREVARDSSGPSEQLLLHSYLTATLHVDPGDPDSAFVSMADLLERALTNAPQILGHLLGEGVHPAWQGLVLLLGVVGWWLVVRRGPTALEGFALLYSLLLVFYFTNGARLALPLVPCLFLYGLTSLKALAGWVLRRPVAGWVLVGGLALAVGGNLSAWPAGVLGGEAASALQPPPGPLRNFSRTAAWLRENTPEQARVLLGQAPILSWLSSRVVYSWKFRKDVDIVDDYAVDYVVFDPPWTAPELRAAVAARAVERFEIGLPGAAQRPIVYRIQR